MPADLGPEDQGEERQRQPGPQVWADPLDAAIGPRSKTIASVIRIPATRASPTATRALALADGALVQRSPLKVP